MRAPMVVGQPSASTLRPIAASQSVSLSSIRLSQNGRSSLPSASNLASAMTPWRGGSRPVTRLACEAYLDPGDGGIARSPTTPSRASCASCGMRTRSPSVATYPSANKKSEAASPATEIIRTRAGGPGALNASWRPSGFAARSASLAEGVTQDATPIAARIVMPTRVASPGARLDPAASPVMRILSTSPEVKNISLGSPGTCETAAGTGSVFA